MTYRTDSRIAKGKEIRDGLRAKGLIREAQAVTDLMTSLTGSMALNKMLHRDVMFLRKQISDLGEVPKTRPAGWGKEFDNAD